MRYFLKELPHNAEGGSIYAASIGDVVADRDVVGAVAAEVASEAIVRAVENAEGAYGFPALRDLAGNVADRERDKT